MKIQTLITFLLFAINCYSQITTVTTKEKPIEIQKYDSLESLNIRNVLLHVGQTIFLKGSSYTKEHDFYYTFYTRVLPPDSRNKDYIYKPTPEKKEGEIVTKYSDAVGKYYKILSV